jgi:hypothetical protein
METVRSLPGVLGTARVQERNAGANKGNADAFRRALQQEGSAEAGAGDADPPMRTRLQPRAVTSRKEGEVNARHVDVIA